MNVTVRGSTCLAWSDFRICVEDNMFPDGSVDAAANYCRDPFRHGYLWCFTNTYLYWDKCLPESCEVTVCSGPSCVNGGRQARLVDECICECAEGFRGDSCEIDITTKNSYQEPTLDQGQETTSMKTVITTENSYQKTTLNQGQETTSMKTDRCDQNLGLTDGNTSALRLNSSSEDSIYSLSRIGLYDIGWCALSGDPNPFVQVDLLTATEIEGLRVQNTFLFIYGEGNSTKRACQAGAKELVISYGNDVEELLTYKEENDFVDKIFSLDDFDYEKNISFRRLFSSRYVKINLVGVWHRPCLRLEIIGCRKSVDYRCKPNSVRRGWASHVEGYVRASKQDVLDIKSFEACAKEADTRNVVAFQYTKETKRCIMLVDNMTTLTWIDKKDYKLQICADVVSSSANIRYSWIDDTGIFSSYGYPFSYNAYQQDMRWTVQLKNNAYPDIYFIDISLGVGDEIRMTQIYTIFGKNASVDLGIITSDMNGHQVRQLSPFAIFEILFNTRLYSNIDVRKGRGFIAIVTSSRYRRCVHECDKFDGFDIYTPGLIISESLLYQPGLSTPRMEIILFDNALSNSIISLSLVYLDVVCSLSQLIVERSIYTWKSTESWCNLNRPLTNESRQILPRANLKITFRSDPVSDASRQEGFELKYVYNPNAHRCITLNSDYNMTKKFCFIMEFNLTKPTWHEASETCRRKHDGRLATLQTEEEFRMAQELVYHSTAYFHMYDSFFRVAYIGFRRNPDGQSKGNSRDFTWLDGRPLVYSAWGGGFPNTLIRWDCAVLNGEKFDEDAHIENTLCTTRVTEMFICEINSSNINAGRKKFNQQIQPSYEGGMNLSHLWKCESGEFIVLAYHCDGIPNCLNASDEKHCIYTAHDNLTCPEIAFQCSDGNCISNSQFCDHITDCKDTSDEYCDYRACGADEFRCNNEQCILKEELCDAKRNCLDGSDEKLCPICSGEGKTTFRCADLKCISIERVCDGFYDCPGMDDEKECTTEAESCQDWWRNGKRMTGVYAVTFGKLSPPVNVECNFDHLNENVLLSTVYNVDYVRTKEWLAYEYYVIPGNRYYDYKLIYPQKEHEVFRYSVNKGRTCTQSITLDCTEPIQKITNIIGKSQYPECICRKWTGYTSISSNIGMSLTQIEEPCFESSLESSDERYQRVIYAGLRQGTQTITNYPSVTIYFLIISTYSQQRITVGPLVCNETFHPDDGRMPCDKGHPVLNKTRCLYNEDRFGSPVGCADMSHTRHCETFICPDNFVKCPGSYCLAVRLVCDGLQQCPNGEDEDNCGSRGRDCPGYFRCNQSNICLPPSQVCDGFEHCPAGDDEIFCNMSCPGTCICQGTFVDCRDGRINATEIALLSPESRKIFFSNSTIRNITVPFILPVAFLVNLSDSGIQEIQPGKFESMKNLRTLDISYNKLTVLRENTFRGLKRLRDLALYNNRYLKRIERGAFRDLENLEEITITHALISFLESATFEGLNKLKKIDLRFSQMYHVENRAFYGLEKLESLFISNNEIKLFENEIFSGLTSLHYLETDKYELCCLKPNSVVEENCFPQKDEFSSCEDLIRNVILRVLLWIIGLFSVVGNVASFIYRKWKLGMQLKMGYGMFVTNLTVADILIGIYLLIIAVADTHFRKTFLWNSEWWRSSAFCTVAGVLSTISSEASIFFVMLITLDRILAVKFPFGQVRLTPRACILVSCLAWLIAIVLSVLPLALNMYFQGKFYSRTTVCLALPLTKDKPPGWEYSFAIFITLNLLLFFMIAFGQLLIFKEMRASSAMIKKQKSSRDKALVVARNLLIVVFANFLCWFPIGVIGILALMNYTIPGDVYAWASVLILPINSVLNPILYTFSAAIKREKFVPESCEHDLISKEDIRRLDELFGFDVIFTTDARTLTCASTCIENRTLNLNQINYLITKITERFDYLHKRMLYYGNLTTDNIWIFLADDQIMGVWLQGKPKRAVNKQVQSADIRFLGSVREALLEPYEHVGQEIKGQERY